MSSQPKPFRPYLLSGEVPRSSRNLAPVLDQRTRLIWTDWMLRHVPEVLLGAARSDLDGLWFRLRPVFQGERSMRMWVDLIPELRHIRSRTERLAMQLHNGLRQESRNRARSAQECLGPFVTQTYFFGRELLPAHLHEVAWSISKLAGETWWAGHRWLEPANYDRVLDKVLDPIRDLKLFWPATDQEAEDQDRAISSVPRTAVPAWVDGEEENTQQGGMNAW